MICDIQNVNQYLDFIKTYGPYCIIFYNPGNSQNFDLYLNLKKFEFEFRDVPIIRFHFEEFQKKYPSEGVESSEDVLIVELNKPNLIEKSLSFQNIRNFLTRIRNERYNAQIKNTKRIPRKRRIRTWWAYSRKHNYSFLLEGRIENAVTMYKFPNFTACLSSLKNRTVVAIRPYPTIEKSNKLLPLQNEKVIQTLQFSPKCANIQFQKSLIIQNISDKQQNILKINPQNLQKNLIHSIHENKSSEIDFSFKRIQKNTNIKIENTNEPLDLSLTKNSIKNSKLIPENQISINNDFDKESKIILNPHIQKHPSVYSYLNNPFIVHNRRYLRKLYPKKHIIITGQKLK